MSRIIVLCTDFQTGKVSNAQANVVSSLSGSSLDYIFTHFTAMIFNSKLGASFTNEKLGKFI